MCAAPSDRLSPVAAALRQAQLFTCRTPQGELTGRLEMPVGGPPRGTALVLHMLGCGRQPFAANQLARALASIGLATWRLDASGLGSSNGDEPNPAAALSVAGIRAALGALQKAHPGPCVLVGHSLGAALTLSAVIAPPAPDLTALILLAAPADPGPLLALLEMPPDPDQPIGGVLPAGLAGRRFGLNAEVLGTASGVLEGLEDLSVPLLILHGGDDLVVGIDQAERLFHAAAQPKSLLVLPGVGHLLEEPAAAPQGAAHIRAWLEGLLGPWVAASATVAVAETGESRFTTCAQLGPHLTMADRPLAAGGGGLGPTPSDRLLADLGSATIMHLRALADRSGWPLEGVAVELSAMEDGGVRQRLTLDGSTLSEAERTALREAADDSPMLRQLSQGLRVETVEKADPSPRDD